LALALSQHVEVTVLAPDAPGANRRERLGDVDVERFTYFWPRSSQRLAITNQRGMRDNLRGSFLAKIQLPLFLLRQTAHMRRMIRRRRIDVVNAHWLVPQGLTAAWALRRFPNVKLVLHVHAGDVYLLQKLSLGRQIARYVVNRTATVFADGSHVRDALNQLLGYDSHAVLQSMGVNRQQFARPAECHSVGEELSSCMSDVAAGDPGFPDGFILFVGRLAEKKGAIYLVQAMRRVLQSKPGVGLVIVGYGPEERFLRAEVTELNLKDRVQFVGRQAHPQIIKLLHACRVAAVPSIIDSRGETEGMPTVVVEALAAGVPVVGSNVDGIPDVIRHAENGWLCREKDPFDLAEKLFTALDCDRRQLEAAALATAEDYDWQQVAANYLSYIEGPYKPAASGVG
jgi:glycosyltransferase involved in cell wall biosynthesis